MPSARSHLQGLSKLRQLRKEGKTLADDYTVDEDDDIYDEVDHEGYRKHLQERLREDDFVVDDNGEGYLDTGADYWESTGVQYESDEGDEPRRRPSKRSKTAAGDKTAPSKPDADLSMLFKLASGKRVQKAVTKEDDDFMDDLISGLGDDSSAPSAAERKRKVPASRARPAPVDDVDASLRTAMTSRTPVASSPPPALVDDDSQTAADDAMTSGNSPDSFPSSPVKPTLAVTQQAAAPAEEEEEDDDMGMKVVRSSKSSARTVNISSVKPRAKPVAPPPRPTDADLSEPSWVKVANTLQLTSESSPISDSELDTSLIVDENGDFSLFWADYEEIGSTLLLYGKVKLRDSDKYISCTLKVQGLCRNVYFLPNEGTDVMEIYEEVSNMLAKTGVKQFLAKPRTRKYCFEQKDVPRETEYLSVLVPFDCPVKFPSSGVNYSQVFGVSSTIFEQFVLARNVMGPCWLNVSAAKFDSGSEAWTQSCATSTSPMDITPIPDSEAPVPPPLNVMSLSIRTVMNHKANKQEIVAISARVYRDMAHDTTTPAEQMKSVLFSAVRPVNQLFPAGFEDLLKDQEGANAKTIVCHKTEANLLNYFMAQLQKHDPDVIVGHQLENIHSSVLLHRLKDLNIRFWHRVGRVRRSAWPSRIDPFTSRKLLSGRLICDISNDMGKSMTIKCDSWSLTEMAEIYLGQHREEFDIDASKYPFIDDAKGLLHFLRHNELDTYLTAAIALKVQILALSKQLTNLAGNSWARTLSGSRVDRNEFILLHEFTKQGYIVPEKTTPQGKQDMAMQQAAESGNLEAATAAAGSNKAKYQGGLVFEPEKGLCNNIVMVMDFNSLYPSIIQEYNICFTTVDRTNCSSSADAVPDVPDSSLPQGIFPRLIHTLVSRRREVKRNMKDPKATDIQKAQWDIKQQALKLTANSMYGCLGFKNSRFYALPLAMLTTSKGREILGNTKVLAEDNGYRVIYGDTDSVMIDSGVTDYSAAVEAGSIFKKKVNERYKKLEIDIDNVYRRILLLAKKKYAAINMAVNNDGEMVTTMEVKGLDLKRREYCQLSKDASTFVLKQLLEGEESLDTAVEQIHDYLRHLARKVREGEINKFKYVIKNKLGKAPSDYPEGVKLPHVLVARRRQKLGDIVKADDVISYVIVKDENAADSSPADRARTLAEVKLDNLDIDGEYYLVSQVLPPVERLCSHLDGTDRVRLAECLGLDIKKHRIIERAADAEEEEIQPLETTISDEVRFKNAKRFAIKCGCGESFELANLDAQSAGVSFTAQGVRCTKCEKSVDNVRINCQLELAILHEIDLYYAGWLTCDDPSCDTRTRQISVYGRKCLGSNGTCRGIVSYEYSDKSIYNQLLYFDSLFDMDKAKKNSALSAAADATPEAKATEQQVAVLAEQNRLRFDVTRKVVAKYLDNCGRRFVDMHEIFGWMS